jgi:hypothetical protein
MYNVEKISNWDIRVTMETNKPCELYVDNFPTTEKNSIRILWVVEPDEVSRIKDVVLGRYNEFDLILTFDTEILEKCPNARLHTFGMTWILDYDLNQEKEFCVTSLIGGKQLSPNHLLRQQLPQIKEKVTNIPIHLFGSINNPFNGEGIDKRMQDGDRKNELFYSQFHIAIENFSKKDFFTEKLMDCFQTKTIPIYMGCTNIGDFFDTRGMFIVNSLEEIENVCSSLTPQTYEDMKPYVEKNYELSQSHAHFRERLKETVINYVNNL